MPESITFYQLDTLQQSKIQQIICDLSFKFYTNNRKVYIFCPDTAYCHQLDEYIISYIKRNFFPYQLQGEGPIPPAPVCLGLTSSHNLKYDILINLHSSIPADFMKYREIIEFVPLEEDSRQLAREHYKHYNKFNCVTKFSNIEHKVHPQIHQELTTD